MHVGSLELRNTENPEIGSLFRVPCNRLKLSRVRQWNAAGRNTCPICRTVIRVVGAKNPAQKSMNPLHALALSQGVQQGFSVSPSGARGRARIADDSDEDEAEVAVSRRQMQQQRSRDASFRNVLSLDAEALIDKSSDLEEKIEARLAQLHQKKEKSWLERD